MQSLELESLSRAIELDPQGGGFVSEQAVQREARKNGLELPGIAGKGQGAPGVSSFGEMLDRSINEVNRQQVEADRAIQELVAGRTKNIHETMLAIERADVSMKLMMQVRNKILDAYREIMRMQI